MVSIGAPGCGSLQDTEAGEGTIPDPVSSWVLANALAWHRGYSRILQPRGGHGLESKFLLGDNSNHPGPDRCPSPVHLPVKNDL